MRTLIGNGIDWKIGVFDTIHWLPNRSPRQITRTTPAPMDSPGSSPPRTLVSKAPTRFATHSASQLAWPTPLDRPSTREPKARTSAVRPWLSPIRPIWRLSRLPLPRTGAGWAARRCQRVSSMVSIAAQLVSAAVARPASILALPSGTPLSALKLRRIARLPHDPRRRTDC